MADYYGPKTGTLAGQDANNVAITGGTITGTTINENFTTSTNPASSVATTTAIVDAYNGVLITTNVNNTQTIANPTAATVKTFTVVNNDTSESNQTVKANGVDFVLTPGEAQSFIWDGSAWGPTDLGITSLPVPVTQGGTGAITLTDHGVLLGSGTDPITALGVMTDGQLVIGSTGADPVVASITDGEGITTTAGAGTLTIACKDASTSNKGVTVYSGTAKALAGTDTASAMTPADVAAKVAVDVNPKAMSQGVAMTAAASGSSAITVAHNDNINFGTDNFTLVWKGSLPDWRPSAEIIFLVKYQAAGIAAVIESGGYPALTVNARYSSLIANNIPDGDMAEIVWVVKRGVSLEIYINGYQHGDMIVCSDMNAINNLAALEILGFGGTRYAGTTHFAAAYNRALTAAEVLDLYRNGIAVKHRKASQTALTSGTLVTGQEYTIDTFAAGDDFANVGGTNETGNVFVATGTTPTTWTNSSSLRATGGTLILEPEGIQPAPGQWLDSSTNKLHAMQPATGSSLTRAKKDFEYRWTNTWTASSAAQYVGGLNQAVLSADHFITDIITQATVTTDVKNLTLGDGSDADRFVTAFTPSATRTKQTVAAQNDGTNLKLVYTPAAEATMTVETIIRGFIWEP